jgi:hypothetical protein
MTNKLVIHPSLEYETRRVAEAQKQLDFTNAVVWACDNEYGPKFVDDSIWSYGAGIEFKELTREQFNFVKSALSRLIDGKLQELKKENNERQLKLTNNTSIGSIGPDNTNVTMWIAFKWGIPDTCEVVSETETKLVTNNQNYFVDDMDGKLYQTKTITKVKCSKPLLEAVFNQQQQA